MRASPTPLLVLAAAAALLLAGCTVPGGPPQPVEGRKVAFEAVEGCATRAAMEHNEVVTTQARWAQFWREMCADGGMAMGGEAAMPPGVDFGRHSVVATFWGEQRTGGYSASVRAITATASGVVVEVDRTTPGPSCSTLTALTYPFDLVRAERLPGEARFEFRSLIATC